jgi:alanine racemase
MVNIGNGEAYVGDSVELFGGNINLWDICKNTSQSPYTVLTTISQRVPRVYI